MLESLITAPTVKRKKTMIFVGSLFFTALSVFLSLFIIPFKVGTENFAGIISVLIASVALSYPLTKYMKEQRVEEELRVKTSEGKLLRRHAHELGIYLAFFFGALVVFAFSAFFLERSFYSLQDQIIGSITGRDFTGNFYAVTGHAVSGQLESLVLILANNLRLFYVTFLLTFFISGGMVFILLWNASVFGVFLARISENIFHIPLIALAFLPHGTLEIAGYVIGGLAGIIFSRQMESFFIERTSTNDVFFRVWKDVWILLMIGSVVILVAGVVEVL